MCLFCVSKSQESAETFSVCNVEDIIVSVFSCSHVARWREWAMKPSSMQTR